MFVSFFFELLEIANNGMIKIKRNSLVNICICCLQNVKDIKLY